MNRRWMLKDKNEMCVWIKLCATLTMTLLLRPQRIVLFIGRIIIFVIISSFPFACQRCVFMRLNANCGHFRHCRKLLFHIKISQTDRLGERKLKWFQTVIFSIFTAPHRQKQNLTHTLTYLKIQIYFICIGVFEQWKRHRGEPVSANGRPNVEYMHIVHAINDNKNKHKHQMVIALKLEWWIICLIIFALITFAVNVRDNEEAKTASGKREKKPANEKKYRNNGIDSQRSAAHHSLSVSLACERQISRITWTITN